MNALKIIKCDDPTMWYASYVGMYVPYGGQVDDVYWSRECEGYKNIVKQSDAEIVDITKTQYFYKVPKLD